MEDTFTYEPKNNTVLEKYEWDNIWWESTDDVLHPHVLYIGDSISCNTRRVATEVSGKTILFDGYGTSKALDNPYYMQTIRTCVIQQVRTDAIIINNGLHGWHIEDEREYAQLYSKVLETLKKEFGDKPLAMVLTTKIRDQEQNKRVIRRNKSAKELAKRYDLPIIDLYSVSDQEPGLWGEDGVHFTAEGNIILANTIYQACKDILGN